MTIYHTGFAVDAVVNAQTGSFAQYCRRYLLHFASYIIVIGLYYYRTSTTLFYATTITATYRSFPSTRDTVETIFSTGPYSFTQHRFQCSIFRFSLFAITAVLYPTLVITFFESFFYRLVCLATGQPTIVNVPNDCTDL